MSIDLLTIRPGIQIRIDDGTVLIVRGSFMSTDGLTFTACGDEKSKVDRNVPASKIIEIIG